MTSLTDALAGLERVGEGWRGVVPDNWLQGRTAYGGFSTALALHAAKGCDADLPPLRSAQVSFVGPLAGAVTVTAQRLRRGRTAAWVQADVTSEAGLGLRAMFVFMAAQESRIDHVTGTPPQAALPGAGDKVLRGLPQPHFTGNFEMVDRRENVGPAEWLRWVRLADRAGLDPEIELVAVADCLPPAALKLAGGPAPVSSMTWLLNVLLPPEPDAADGWWLLGAATEHARAGASSQDMRIWDGEGRAVAHQMQSVALFV